MQGQRGSPIELVELRYSCLQWPCRFTISCWKVLLTQRDGPVCYFSRLWLVSTEFIGFLNASWWLLVLTMTNGTTSHLLFLRRRGNGRDVCVTWWTSNTPLRQSWCFYCFMLGRRSWCGAMSQGTSTVVVSWVLLYCFLFRERVFSWGIASLSSIQT